MKDLDGKEIIKLIAGYLAVNSYDLEKALERIADAEPEEK